VPYKDAEATAADVRLDRRDGPGRAGAYPWILLDIAHHGVVLYDPESILALELDAVRRRMADLGARRIELPDGSWYWDLKPDWQPGEVVDL
jgi:hypothetical protein